MHNIQNERVLGKREIKIPSHKTSALSHIADLQNDLDLVLVEVLEVSDQKPKKTFTLATANYRLKDQEAVTPLMDSLHALNNHIKENINEIVQEYLFGFVEEDVKLSSVSI